MTDDGRALLGGPRAGTVLRRALVEAGGELLDWQLEHLDHLPDHSTTATYRARVRWPHLASHVGAERDELLGISMHSSGHSPGGFPVATPDGEASVWVHPHDPELPGLVRACVPERLAELLVEVGLVGHPPEPSSLQLAMVAYRPRRRAVLRATVAGQTVYLKVLRPDQADDVVTRHALLAGSLVRAPRVLAHSHDHVLVLDELPGRSLAEQMLLSSRPARAHDVISLLDALPPSVAQLRQRPAWSEGVAHYAEVVSRALPHEAGRLHWLVDQVEQLVDSEGPGSEATHGDLHQGQLHVQPRRGAAARVVGLLDVDQLGPGHRVDDLACLVAHLSCVQHMDAEQTRRVHGLLCRWVPAFDERVDPTSLRIRAAGVLVSLATGPHRDRQPDWIPATTAILDSAEALVRQVR